MHDAAVRTPLIAVLLVAVAACSNTPKAASGADAAASAHDGAAGDGAVGDGAPQDLDMQASDFECILRWTMVGGYRITNKLGNDALSVANSPTGGVFPVGTIVQIVPTEAMVKRRVGFSTETHDWEFFSLGVTASGTTINTRGTTDVVNAFGGNCLNCHMAAMSQYDMICGTTHGCAALPLSEAQLIDLQNADPRCP